MTRAEILSLLTQAAAALTTEPQTPAQWTEEDHAMLKDIHAATAAQRRTAATSTGPVTPAALAVQGVPMFTSIPASTEPPLGPLESEPKKKRNFWQKLGRGMKTTLVAVGAGGGGAALSAVVDAVKDGNVSPTGLATAAIGAAVAGTIGYHAKPPEKGE